MDHARHAQGGSAGDAGNGQTHGGARLLDIRIRWRQNSTLFRLLGYGDVSQATRLDGVSVGPRPRLRIQKRPRARSFCGSTSRQVVHQPERIVSMNSPGSRSASISAASASWSYWTGMNSTSTASPIVSSAYHTRGVPSFSGRPSAPTLTT